MEDSYKDKDEESKSNIFRTVALFASLLHTIWNVWTIVGSFDTCFTLLGAPQLINRRDYHYPLLNDHHALYVGLNITQIMILFGNIFFSWRMITTSTSTRRQVEQDRAACWLIWNYVMVAVISLFGLATFILIAQQTDYLTGWHAFGYLVRDVALNSCFIRFFHVYFSHLSQSSQSSQSQLWGKGTEPKHMGIYPKVDIEN